MGGASDGKPTATSLQLVLEPYSWMFQSTNEVYLGKSVGLCRPMSTEEFTAILADGGERVTTKGVGALEPPQPAKPRAIAHSRITRPTVPLLIGPPYKTESAKGFFHSPLQHRNLGPPPNCRWSLCTTHFTAVARDNYQRIGLSPVIHAEIPVFALTVYSTLSLGRAATQRRRRTPIPIENLHP